MQLNSLTPTTLEADGVPQRTPPEEVRAQLGRLLVSKYFRTSPRLRRFLSFTVEQALNGYEGRLKEYSIALEVFGKPESFDPRVDSAVRVAARQLRAKLDSYYFGEGTHDEVLIRFRPGDYVPRFYSRNGNHVRASDGDGQNHEEHTRVVVVDKERSTVRSLMEALDTLNYSLAAVVDSGEQALQAVERVEGALVIAGLVLAGEMNGSDLTRLVHSTLHSPIVLTIPPTLGAELLGEIVDSEPDAIIFKPVRLADVSSALQIAIAKSGRDYVAPLQLV